MNSMTGFGRGSAMTETWLAKVELSTVNRKQAEVVVQLPRELADMDGRIRKLVQLSVSRGRVQVNVSLEATQSAAASVRLDAALASSLEAAFTQLSGLLGREVRPSAADFLRQPGVLAIGSRDMDPESAWAAIQPALAEALAQLAAMRRREGADLLADFEGRLDTLDKLRRILADAAQERPLRQRDLLLKRLREAGLELDPADERVVKELALFADRCDITEELTRLDSHCAKFREYLHATDPPGRALDFLCQEIFREFNTIGAKANAAAIAQTIVEAKTELEKIREQVQNVE
ncbi:MAG: YicC family protein [Verrucomicrobia bacterium]|nr:MAG: YicC family protein [Verrucomicrobiota bacterium]